MVARPRDCTRPGILSANGPDSIPEKRVRTSISIGRRLVSAAPGSASSGSGTGGSRRVNGRLLHLGRVDYPVVAQTESLAVNDDLAPSRVEDPDHGLDQSNVSLAGRTTDHDHVRPAGPVHVHDLAENRVVNVLHGRADDLMPIELAPRQFLARSDDSLQIHVAERLRGVPVGHLRKAKTPTEGIRR